MSALPNRPRTAETLRAWRGAAILSHGFRPFFLAAALWALAAIFIWPLVFLGAFALPTAFSPIDWHAHEMIFGYLAAVVAGFLMTAIPNWTGRLPVSGPPLAGLVALWAAGRLAIFVSAAIGRPLAALVDGAFLVVFAAVIWREILAGKNRRNLKVVAIVGFLAAVNFAFHYEDVAAGAAEYSARAALSLIVLLILLIGGRVTPSFTGNWIQRQGDGKRPAPFSQADGVMMVVAGLALAAWTVAPDALWTGALALAGGLGNFWRLSRWRGFFARRDALVFVLHLGFGLASAGFLLVAAHGFWPRYVGADAAVHAWAVGGAGVMTLAMMTRATLGHSGRALVASAATKLAYLFVVVALVARLALAFLPAEQIMWLTVAASAWCLAFVAFLAGYAPLLLKRPPR